ncbi:MAG: hypothetical protein HYX67_16100 [Candidatus Melainabacteria bacterium]|nr:hypothetical protein [Candidatus Melainabacteria bacterium]
MSELPIALLMLFILLMFPLIDLAGLATGASIAFLIAHQSAARAASHQRYDSALTAMSTEANNFLSTGFANFARLTPVGGYDGSGADLYILATNYRGGGIKVFGPNQPVSEPIDPSTCLYECNVRVKYKVGPVISMANAPFISEIPGLGKPAVLSFEENRAAEYPIGLNKIGDLANSSTNQGPNVATLNIPWDAAMNPAGSSWNNPTIYQTAESQGLRCVDDDVIVVPANSFQWTKTHFRTIGKIFLDVRSDGSWSVGGNNGEVVSADGYRAKLGGNNLPVGALIGKIGASGQPFYLGSSQMGFVPPNGGNDTFYLAMNAGAGPVNTSTDPLDPATADIYAKSTGAQIVRVISAR